MASYYVWSGATGSANGTTWANAYTTLTAALSGKVAGDVFYVAHDHAESTAGAVTLTAPGTPVNPNKFICADRAGTVPPVSADRRTTASVTATGSVFLTLGSAAGTGNAHYDGIIFNASTLAAGGGVVVAGGSGTPWQRFDNCSFRVGSTGAAAGVFFGNSGTTNATYVELNNTTLSFAATGNQAFVSGVVKWRNTASALIGAAVPNFLFVPVGSHGADLEVIGVDLSAAGSGKTLGSVGSVLANTAKFKLIDCKLNASVTKSVTPVSTGASEVDFIRSGSAGVNYTVASYRYAGTLTEETTIVRIGGATDGTTPISWKVITTANSSYSLPFVCPVIAIWNDTTGSAKTATIECVGAALPNDDEVWLDLEYLGDASSPQGSFVNDGKANLLATAAAQTTSAESWGGSTAKFKLSVTFTAQQKGWLYARVKVAKASSTFYIDPLITLT